MISRVFRHKSRSKLGEMTNCQALCDPGPTSHDTFESNWDTRASISSTSDRFSISAASESATPRNQLQNESSFALSIICFGCRLAPLLIIAIHVKLHFDLVV